MTKDEEIEQLRVQLAGCSSAAMGYGGGCKRGYYGWSVSFDDVQTLYEKYAALIRVAEAARELRSLRLDWHISSGGVSNQFQVAWEALDTALAALPAPGERKAGGK